MTDPGPELDFLFWHETCAALHLYTEVVGKYRLAREPWINHSWHATFYVNSRGLTTFMIPDGPRGVEIQFDLLRHEVIGSTTDGRTKRFNLGSMSVAEFHGRFLEVLRALNGLSVHRVRDRHPNE